VFFFSIMIAVSTNSYAWATTTSCTSERDLVTKQCCSLFTCILIYVHWHLHAIRAHSFCNGSDERSPSTRSGSTARWPAHGRCRRSQRRESGRWRCTKAGICGPTRNCGRTAHHGQRLLPPQSWPMPCHTPKGSASQHCRATHDPGSGMVKSLHSSDIPTTRLPDALHTHVEAEGEE